MTNGASRSRLREYNARTVIHALRRGGPASQSEIAERAGLSVPAVSAIMRSLTEEGYIREVRSDNPGRGRPRVIVDVVPEAAYSLGIPIDPALITAVLLGLRGTVVEVNHRPEVDPSDPTRTLRVAAGMARAVTPDGSRGDRVVGACLAVPGRVDSVIGGIADSVWLPGWNGRPLGPILAASIGREVRVVKDTYAAMVGEQWVRGGDLLEATSVFVYLGVGTGLGLTVAGAATSGGSGNAGQVGRIFESLGVTREDATMQDPANLVHTAHDRGILPGPPPQLRDMPALDRDFRALCASAFAGDPRARQILTESAHRVIQAAAIASDLLDARCVVFGGPYWEIVEPLYGPMARDALSADGARPGVQVLSSAQGTDAGAIGAASTVLDAHFVPRAPR